MKIQKGKKRLKAPLFLLESFGKKTPKIHLWVMIFFDLSFWPNFHKINKKSVKIKNFTLFPFLVILKFREGGKIKTIILYLFGLLQKFQKKPKKFPKLLT